MMRCCGKRSPEEGDKPETRRPSDSKFKQQKLPAWQPILTASTVLPMFFVIGIVFLSIGIALLVTSNKIKEKVIEYSEDSNCAYCKSNLSSAATGKPSNCSCYVEFSLDEQWSGDVYFYYRLTNFYQNHRRYVRSRDNNQLHGEISSSVTPDCKPFKESENKTVLPCGAIANSMFNDKFILRQKDTNTKKVPWTAKDIAWKSDRETKFRNPTGDISGFSKPPRWFQDVTNLGIEDGQIGVGDGLVNQDFINWMRVAAFPTFRKLYRKLNRGKNTTFADGLPAGDYKLTIQYNFPVKDFDGKKQFVLTTPSWIGGKNPFLGIAYIVVGCLCLIFGVIFLVIHIKVRTRPLAMQ